MVGSNGNGEWQGWKIEVAQATVRQGPVSIILLCMMYAAWHWGDWLLKTGIPTHLNQIQAGYAAIQASHDRNVASMIKAQQESVDRIQESLNKATVDLRQSNAKLESALADLINHEKTDDKARDDLIRSLKPH